MSDANDTTPDTPAGGAVACPRCGAPCRKEVGWGDDASRTVYRYAPPATVPADAVLALVERLSEPRTLSQFMGPHDMALALIEERNAIRDELEALTRGEGK